MQVKISSITPFTPEQLSIEVNFVDDYTVVLSKTYLLRIEQEIESLYPQFKEDINNLEAAKNKIQTQLPAIGETINLINVKSYSELKAEEAMLAQESPLEI